MYIVSIICVCIYIEWVLIFFYLGIQGAKKKMTFFVLQELWIAVCIKNKIKGLGFPSQNSLKQRVETEEQRENMLL